MSLLDKIQKSIDSFKWLSKWRPEYVWEIGFSGGKDSTAVLHLVFMFVQDCLKNGSELPRDIYIVYGDTLVEIPSAREPSLRVMKEIETYSRENLEGVIKTAILKPKDNEDFFTKMIDDGYPPPHFRFRWCMKRLKIDPAVKFVSSLKNRTDFFMVSGIRVDESSTRSRNIKARTCGEMGMIQRGQNGDLMIAPLINWTKDDVFAFLAHTKQPWNGDDYCYLFDAYGTDEIGARCACGLSPNVRYGCWVCTVIKKDKALELLIAKGSKNAKILLRAKECIRKIGLTPKYREIKPNGRYGRLNKWGRLAVIAVLTKVLSEAPEGLVGYTRNLELRERLIRWIKQLNTELDREPGKLDHFGILKILEGFDFTLPS